jgi:hypothetical protein
MMAVPRCGGAAHGPRIRAGADRSGKPGPRACGPGAPPVRRYACRGASRPRRNPLRLAGRRAAHTPGWPSGAGNLTIRLGQSRRRRAPIRDMRRARDLRVKAFGARTLAFGLARRSRPRAPRTPGPAERTPGFPAPHRPQPVGWRRQRPSAARRCGRGRSARAPGDLRQPPRPDLNRRIAAASALRPKLPVRPMSRDRPCRRRPASLGPLCSQKPGQRLKQQRSRWDRP